MLLPPRSVPGNKQAARRSVERLRGYALPVRQDRLDVRSQRHELVGLAALGNNELHTDAVQDVSLDVERRPRIVRDENSRGHGLNVSVVVARARVAAG